MKPAESYDHDFYRSVRAAVDDVGSAFLDIEQMLLEQKSFEDMAFTSSGFCENGDFFYLSHAAGERTSRELLGDYMELKEQFDHFATSLLSQTRDVSSENRSAFTSWTQEQLLEYRMKLREIVEMNLRL